MGGGTAGGLWRHQQWTPSRPPVLGGFYQELEIRLKSQKKVEKTCVFTQNWLRWLKRRSGIARSRVQMPLKSWIFFSGFLRNCINKLCSQLRGSFFIWFHSRSSMSNQGYYYITFLPTSHKTAHGLEFIKRVSQSDYSTLFHMEHSQLPQRVQLF